MSRFDLLRQLLFEGASPNGDGYFSGDEYRSLGSRVSAHPGLSFFHLERAQFSQADDAVVQQPFRDVGLETIDHLASVLLRQPQVLGEVADDLLQRHGSDLPLRNSNKDVLP